MPFFFLEEERMGIWPKVLEARRSEVSPLTPWAKFVVGASRMGTNEHCT